MLTVLAVRRMPDAPPLVTRKEVTAAWLGPVAQFVGPPTASDVFLARAEAAAKQEVRAWLAASGSSLDGAEEGRIPLHPALVHLASGGTWEEWVRAEARREYRGPPQLFRLYYALMGGRNRAARRARYLDIVTEKLVDVVRQT